MAVVGGATASAPPHADTADKGRALRAAFSFRTAAANDTGSDNVHRLGGSSANAGQGKAPSTSPAVLTVGNASANLQPLEHSESASAAGDTAGANASVATREAAACPTAPPAQESRPASDSTPPPRSTRDQQLEQATLTRRSASDETPVDASNRDQGSAIAPPGGEGVDRSDGEMPLPRSTMPLDQQIAGHRHGHGKTKLGMLRHQDGSILKPLMPNDARAKREHEFYQFLEQHRETCPENSPEECDDPVLHGLIDLTPRYLGVFETDFAVPAGEGFGVSYMKLEDLCQRFKQPCIADLKIGRVTHDPEASAEKIEQSVSKYPAQWDIGYRILGMRVYEQGQCRVYDADYGLQQTAKSVPEAIRTFTAANPACLPLIVAELDRIMEWFLLQNRFAFYSSSILFVYDAVEPRCAVKLIDFAHVFPTATPDENYLFGLRNLVDAFRAVASLGSSRTPLAS